MKRVNGSAILESVIATVIIAVCIAFSYTYISNLLTADRSSLRIKARYAFQQLLKAKDFRDASFEYEGFTVHQSVNSSKLADGIVTIEFEAVDAGNKTILISKHLRNLNE